VLEISHLTKAYEQQGGKRQDRRLLVLDDISFTVPRNQFVCLLGPSGCGKTTLIRIVAGLTQADHGQVLVNRKVVTRPGPDRSMVFQNYGLLPWRTVLGNVEFGLEIRGLPKAQRRSICQHYIDKVGLRGFEHHYPHQLSGGMQQRAGLARALSKEPEILLMDEPFAAVDMQTREMLQDELLRIWNQTRTTVVFVTHSIEEAIYLGDRVIVMSTRPGRVRADVPIDLPRPRYESDVKSSAHFGELRGLIREALRGAQPAGVA
jgi:NitT/TauT family transport system ATP-binding protein